MYAPNLKITNTQHKYTTNTKIKYMGQFPYLSQVRFFFYYQQGDKRVGRYVYGK